MTDISILSEKTTISDYYKLNVDVAFRYYLSNSAPIGFYLSPSLELQEYNITDLFDLNLLVGYQNIIPNTNIYFDFALGIKYRYRAIRYYEKYHYGEYRERPIGSTGLFSVGYLF
ncbi:hypothetical protein JBKA6_1024 [Ichthyobacterium seriolicida]|uniref:Uncharacterized protein n=2 Tax=Ichthyobacterium seriolicida TaxID=242600 RepID=A0A1J1E254_9FLAO|nr:hypothetical protein JBKA6_1024 [Ichthyobacterium seriolicida]